MSSFVIEKLINPSPYVKSDKKIRGYRLSGVLLGLYVFLYGYRYYRYRETPDRGDYVVGGLLSLGWLGGL